MTARIVLTGAPGSGKTACLDRFKSDGAFRHFVFFDELARQILIQNPAYRTKWAEFHRAIYHAQTEREAAVTGQPFLTDRGTIDAFAFHPETLIAAHTSLEQEYTRYTAVVHLGTTAKLGMEYYQIDEVRRESPEDALVIESALAKAWKGHPQYHFIDATPLWEEKLRACRNLVCRIGGLESAD